MFLNMVPLLYCVVPGIVHGDDRTWRRGACMAHGWAHDYRGTANEYEYLVAFQFSSLGEKRRGWGTANRNRGG